MATQEKVNPIFDNKPLHFNGKSVTAVTVTLGDMTGEEGATGAINTAIHALTNRATPILMSGIADITVGEFDIYFEGDFYTVVYPEGTFADALAADCGAAVVFQGVQRYGLVGETPLDQDLV